jgi:hypothetical protein
MAILGFILADAPDPAEGRRRGKAAITLARAILDG